MNESNATIDLFKSEKWQQVFECTATALQINLVLFEAGAEKQLSEYGKCPFCGKGCQTFDISDINKMPGITGNFDQQARDVFRLGEKYLVAARSFPCGHTGSALDFHETVNMARILLTDIYDVVLNSRHVGSPAAELTGLRQLKRLILSMVRNDADNPLEYVINLLLSAAVVLFDAGGAWLEYATDGRRHLLTKGSLSTASEKKSLMICKTVAAEIHSPEVDGILGIIAPDNLDKADMFLEIMVNECVIIFEINQLLVHMESLLPLFLNVVDSIVLMADGRKHICFANKAAAQLLGRPVHELVGLAVCDIDTPWQQCFLAESQTVTKGIQDVLRRGHDERIVDWEVYPLSGSLEMPGWLILARDRTDYYHLQEMAESTENLVQASTLLRAIAHEIRNPMTTFKGLLQIIDLKSGTDEISKYVGIGMNEIKKITLLLDEYSQSGKTADISMEKTDMKTFMEELYNLAVTGFSGPGIEIASSFNAVTPVMIDKRQLTQAIFSLVKNAYEALNRRGKISLSLMQHEQTWVEIRVCDNGPGISDQIKDKLFKPYFSTKADGTGLGLAIVNSVVRNHNGSISVNNSPDGGACFSILLPTRESEEKCKEQ